MKKIIRYNLEIFTGIMLLFCMITVVFWKDMSLVRKLAAGYMLLYVMHEWEEGRFPGGFYDLFFDRIGAEVKGDPYAMHVPAAVLIIVFTLLPWVFDQVYLLLVPPIGLSLFEGFIHTLGIKLMKTKKPYTPGMITAWMMFAFAIYSIKVLPPLGSKIWLLGIALLLVEFIGMQRTFIHLAGYSYRELIPLAKKNILGIK
jgi:hypothetical protein